MLVVLEATTDTLKVVSSTAAGLDCVVSHIDCTTASPPVTDQPDNTATAIPTATTTTIMAAPGGTKRRILKGLTIRNTHASLSCDVTIGLDISGTLFTIHKVTLVAGAMVSWTEGLGWFLYEPPLTAISRRAVLLADQSNSTTTPTEVTALSITTGLGYFKFQYLIRYQSAATTTGVRYSVNHTGTVAYFLANMLWVDVSATAATAAADQDAVLSTGSVYGSMAARAKSTAGWGTTISVDTANADMMIIIDGIMQVTVDGDIELWHGSEVAAASTTKVGTSLVLEKCG